MIYDGCALPLHTPRLLEPLPMHFAAAPTLETPRLSLRAWRSADLAPLAALNADTQVMRHFPAPLSRAESHASVARIQRGFVENGFGWWAVERQDSGVFIGMVGLLVPRYQTAFTPCVEIGWRLAAAHWGQGYAPEAARAVLRFGFEQKELREIVAITVVGNRPSRRVMEKLSMRCDPAEDFDHPSLPVGHPLQRHALYRLGAAAFKANASRADLNEESAAPPPD